MSDIVAAAMSQHSDSPHGVTGFNDPNKIAFRHGAECEGCQTVLRIVREAQEQRDTAPREAVTVAAASDDDIRILCENCNEREFDMMTEDDVPLCYECELACIDGMAMHDETCPLSESQDSENESADDCTCDLAGQITRRKAYLETQVKMRKAEDALRLLHGATRALAEQFDFDWPYALVAGNLQARSILFQRANAILAEHGMAITKDEIANAQGWNRDTVKSRE